MKAEDSLKVLDNHLAKQDWLAKDYSIADIANWCWVRTYKWSGISIEGLDHLERWMKAMYGQPGMSAGLEVPIKMESLLDDDKKAKEFAKNAEKMVKK
jgi:glutathione S-transferase